MKQQKTIERLVEIKQRTADAAEVLTLIHI